MLFERSYTMRRKYLDFDKWEGQLNLWAKDDSFQILEQKQAKIDIVIS